MTRVRSPHLAAGALAALLLAAPSHAAQKNPPTIKDLDAQDIDVSTAAPKNVDANKTMDSYKRFLDLNAGDAALRSEALRRLGDLNLESSESERIERELITNEGLRATEAIHLYSALLKAYPKYERNDSVLYQLARAYELNAQPEKALASMDQLVAAYPKSHYIDEVQFRRGELLFNDKAYAKAQAAYEAVIKIGASSGFYNQSLYKHGWTLFKQGESERSLASFAGVLDSELVSKRDPNELIELETLSRPNRELVEDTFRVMSITFSYADGPKTVDDFVKHRKRPYYYLMYERLGDLYIEKERYTDAADSYRAFVSQDRNNEKAPLLEMQAIVAYQKGGFPQLVLQGKKEFVENYSFGTAYWNGRDPKNEPKVIAELKTNLKDVAQHYHAEAQRSKNVTDYQEAAKWYRSYLTSYPDDPDSAVTNFLLAETLFDSKQYLDAAKEYESTAYHYGNNEKAAAAGYAAIVAYGKQEETLSGEAKAAVHGRGLDSSLKFAQTFPGHPESAQVLTRAATDLYTAKDYPRALGAAEALLARQPPVDAGKQRIAWTVIGNANFDQSIYDKAEAAYGHAQALMPANDPEHPVIVERLAASIYKQGEQKAKSGDNTAAVDDFLRVAALAPTSKARANADFDAAALLVKDKQWDRAIVVLEGFRRNFPQSPLQANVTRDLAVAYTESNHPGQAAVEFEQIAQSPGEAPDVQREATLQAADFYDKAGNTPKSRAMLEAFVKHFPQPLDPAMEARTKLSAISAKSGEMGARDYWLKEIIAADRAAGAARTDRSRALAAKATLTLATPQREEFRRIKLVVPLKKSLVEKRKAMEAALKAYEQAADYQVAEVTTAATFESAELYRQLGKDLMSSERPRNLNKEELEQYNVLLEEQAFPFEEKAIKLHEVNAARTKSGTYDEWVQKSFAALAELNPGRYAKVEEGPAVAAAPASGGAAPPAGGPAAAPTGTATGAGPATAATAAPVDPPIPERAAQQYAQALQLMKSGRNTDAELEFKQLAVGYPQLSGPQLNLGLLYLHDSRLAEAETAFKAALDLSPANPVAGNELGIVERRLGKFAEAEAAYRRTIAADSQFAAAHLNLGVLYDLYLAEPKKALDEYGRYIEIAGENKQVAGWMIELRKRAGVPAAAPASAPAPESAPAPPPTPAPAPTSKKEAA
jgi:tetratricopeptide (TPR) repeat protein